ncbi:MAG: IPT/TIG domain-containing protein [Casimicrobiaceae bacterium]
MGSDVPEFTARFNSVAVPLTVNTIEPSVIGDDGIAVEAVVRGTGFTSASRVFVDGVQIPATYVDGNTLRVTLSRALMRAPGRVPVFVQNALSSNCNVSSNSVALDVLPSGHNAFVRLTEFYNEAFDYYFLTGRDADKRLLDGLVGWRRTGQEIRLQAVGNEQTVPLERHFFADVARGGTRGSHFFTSLADEQRLLTGLNPTNAPGRAKPVLEGIEGHAFPLRADGTCPPPSIPVYRAFKAAPRYPDDGNHRFTTSLAIHRDMVDRLGWVDEGVRFCALP